jgi:hypothetical protein
MHGQPSDIDDLFGDPSPEDLLQRALRAALGIIDVRLEALRPGFSGTVQRCLDGSVAMVVAGEPAAPGEPTPEIHLRLRVKPPPKLRELGREDARPEIGKAVA